MKKILEVCCGSLEDSLIAESSGADRIELNNATYLDGLTPSIGTVELVLENCNIPVVVMVRPRAGGFNYNDSDFETMVRDVEILMKYDIEGLAFGCLDKNFDIDVKKNQRIVDIISKNNKIAVFHKAFDATKDPFKSMEILIDMGVKRVLTSGLDSSAIQGAELISKLQKQYGSRIEILVGGGVNDLNVIDLNTKTEVNQYHSSCKTWEEDPTTISNKISFAFADKPHESDYNLVSAIKVKNLVKVLKEL
jgi:copper homeostasis protein